MDHTNDSSEELPELSMPLTVQNVSLCPTSLTVGSSLENASESIQQHVCESQSVTHTESDASSEDSNVKLIESAVTSGVSPCVEHTIGHNIGLFAGFPRGIANVPVQAPQCVYDSQNPTCSINEGPPSVGSADNLGLPAPLFEVSPYVEHTIGHNIGLFAGFPRDIANVPVQAPQCIYDFQNPTCSKNEGPHSDESAENLGLSVPLLESGSPMPIDFRNVLGGNQLPIVEHQRRLHWEYANSGDSDVMVLESSDCTSEISEQSIPVTPRDLPPFPIAMNAGSSMDNANMFPMNAVENQHVISREFDTGSSDGDVEILEPSDFSPEMPENPFPINFQNTPQFPRSMMSESSVHHINRGVGIQHPIFENQPMLYWNPAEEEEDSDIMVIDYTLPRRSTVQAEPDIVQDEPAIVQAEPPSPSAGPSVYNSNLPVRQHFSEYQFVDQTDSDTSSHDSDIKIIEADSTTPEDPQGCAIVQNVPPRPSGISDGLSYTASNRQYNREYQRNTQTSSDESTDNSDIKIFKTADSTTPEVPTLSNFTRSVKENIKDSVEPQQDHEAENITNDELLCSVSEILQNMISNVVELSARMGSLPMKNASRNNNSKSRLMKPQKLESNRANNRKGTAFSKMTGKEHKHLSKLHRTLKKINEDSDRSRHDVKRHLHKKMGMKEFTLSSGAIEGTSGSFLRPIKGKISHFKASATESSDDEDIQVCYENMRSVKRAKKRKNMRKKKKKGSKSDSPRTSSSSSELESQSSSDSSERDNRKSGDGSKQLATNEPNIYVKKSYQKQDKHRNHEEKPKSIPESKQNYLYAACQVLLSDIIEQIELIEFRELKDVCAINAEELCFGLMEQHGKYLWYTWLQQKSDQEKFNSNLLKGLPSEIARAMTIFLDEVPVFLENYSIGYLYYIMLGLQTYMLNNGRKENIFADATFSEFALKFNNIIEHAFSTKITEVTMHTVPEEYLWKSGQLGVKSPQVMLETLIFFHVKYLKMMSVDDHLNLKFGHVRKMVKNHKEGSGVYLYYYPPFAKGVSLQIHEKCSDPMRCPIRIFDVYLTKCPLKARIDQTKFYLKPNFEWNPDNLYWYNEESIQRSEIVTILRKFSVVTEINSIIENFQLLC